MLDESEYQSIEDSKGLIDGISSIKDVKEFGTWDVYEKEANEISFTINNSKENNILPLMILIRGDKKVKLYTTPYDENIFEDSRGFYELAHKNFSRDESAYEWFCNNFRGKFPSFSFDGYDIRYLSKEDVLDYLLSANAEKSNVKLPVLKSEKNNSETVECSKCEVETKRVFQFHLSDSAGSTSVVYEWDPELRQLIVKGEYCPYCETGVVELYGVDGEFLYSKTV